MKELQDYIESEKTTCLLLGRSEVFVRIAKVRAGSNHSRVAETCATINGRDEVEGEFATLFSPAQLPLGSRGAYGIALPGYRLSPLDYYVLLYKNASWADMIHLVRFCAFPSASNLGAAACADSLHQVIHFLSEIGRFLPVFNRIDCFCIWIKIKKKEINYDSFAKIYKAAFALSKSTFAVKGYIEGEYDESICKKAYSFRSILISGSVLHRFP